MVARVAAMVVRVAVIVARVAVIPGVDVLDPNTGGYQSSRARRFRESQVGKPGWVCVLSKFEWVEEPGGALGWRIGAVTAV